MPGALKEKEETQRIFISQEKSSEDTERKWSLANGEKKKNPDLLPL